MPKVVFVMSARQPYPLHELAATLAYELELQGVPSSLHLGWFPPGDHQTVNVLPDPHGYLQAEGEQAVPDDGVLRRTVLLCHPSPEPPEPGRAQRELLARAGAVFALDQRAVVGLHRSGIRARLLRPGYSRSLDHFDPDAERPIDVMFLGTHSRRRTRHLARAAHTLARHNCLIQIADRLPSEPDTSSFRGESRWSLLKQTKVLVNLHRDEGTRLEWRRVVDAVHAGAVVVTEHSSGIAPLVAGEHLLVAGAEALPQVVDALVRDGARLAALRTRAYERLRDWVPYALWVSVLRAAVVELVGEPVPAPSLTPPPLPPPPAQVAAPPPAAPPAPAEPGASRGGEPRWQASRARTVARSDCWSVRRAPRVSVLTVIGEQGRGLGSTLASVMGGRLRDVELVLVGEGDGLTAAAEWVRAHRYVSAVALDARGSSGVGAARNLALAAARAAYCLILDAGQVLYPRAPEVLTWTLDAMPDVAFVYPIAEVAGDTEGFAAAGGDHLMSYLGWDPVRLRDGNTIHAPALVRTDVLLELGGFATDPRLAGFEDYDLWCRIADRGGRGQLVPQVLVRRPESAASPALATMLRPSGPPAKALMERAPRLMADVYPGPHPWLERMKSPRSVR